jgi:D-alanyl-D-alanine dipeptidase
MFWDATPEEHKIFVADPASGSRHNRGSAVDVTLVELDADQPVRMVGGYDEFSERSYARYPGGTSLQRWLRDLLRRAMEAEEFNVYEFEWWHFDHAEWSEYPILNIAFDEIGSQGGDR